jgi:hypothetical protein
MGHLESEPLYGLVIQSVLDHDANASSATHYRVHLCRTSHLNPLHKKSAECTVESADIDNVEILMSRTKIK